MFRCIYMIIVFLTIYEFANSQSHDTLKVSIINFLYTPPESQTKLNLEQSLFLPNLDQNFNISGLTSDIKIAVEVVDNVELQNTTKALASKTFRKTPKFDVGIFSIVKMLEEGKYGNYNVDLLVFNNHKKAKQKCTSYYEFEIRKERITRWGNRKCDLPTNTMVYIPTLFCYNFYPNKKGGKYDSLKIKMQEVLGDFPLKDAIGWHSNNECNTIEGFGGVKIDLLKNYTFSVPIPHHLYLKMYLDLVDGGVAYNHTVPDFNIDLLRLFGNSDFIQGERSIENANYYQAISYYKLALLVNRNRFSKTICYHKMAYCYYFLGKISDGNVFLSAGGETIRGLRSFDDDFKDDFFDYVYDHFPIDFEEKSRIKNYHNNAIKIDSRITNKKFMLYPDIFNPKRLIVVIPVHEKESILEYKILDKSNVTVLSKVVHLIKGENTFYIPINRLKKSKTYSIDFLGKIQFFKIPNLSEDDVYNIKIERKKGYFEF